MARSLRRNHGHIHILRRLNAAEMNIKSMGKHQHIACLQIRLNILLVHVGLQLVVDQDHDHVSPLGSLSRGVHLKTLGLGLSPGLAPLIKPDDHIAPGLLGVEGVGMSLAAVADNRDGLAIQHRQITIFLIITAITQLLMQRCTRITADTAHPPPPWRAL